MSHLRILIGGEQKNPVDGPAKSCITKTMGEKPKQNHGMYHLVI
jgi:hypothetical protein